MPATGSASSTGSIPSGTVPNTVSTPSHPFQENQIENNSDASKENKDNIRITTLGWPME